MNVLELPMRLYGTKFFPFVSFGVLSSATVSSVPQLYRHVPSTSTFSVKVYFVIP